MKNDNTNYSTDIRDIFEFRIDLDEFEPVNILIGNKEKIYKIDYFLNEEFCSISSNYINLYNTKFKIKFSESNSLKILDYNFIPDTQQFAFLSMEKLYIC